MKYAIWGQMRALASGKRACAFILTELWWASMYMNVPECVLSKGEEREHGKLQIILRIHPFELGFACLHVIRKMSATKAQQREQTGLWIRHALDLLNTQYVSVGEHKYSTEANRQVNSRQKSNNDEYYGTCCFVCCILNILRVTNLHLQRYQEIWSSIMGEHADSFNLANLF